LLLAASACAHDPEIGRTRFQNVPIVWRVDDRRPIAEKPEERKFHRRYTVLNNAIVEPIDRTLAVPDPVYAQNINALDEVPDSSWFDNRLLRGLTPEEVLVGPRGQSAANLRPWKIVSTKSGGKSLGFVIEDSRGDEHLLKFDSPGFPELKSAAGVVVQRLMWALGYHVPADDVVEFDTSDLILPEDAIERFDDNERPLTKERLEELLGMVEHDGNRLRGLISRMLPGEPIGGYPNEGLREDDPNDVVPHEHRRDLRAHFMFFAWVDHTDWKEDNRLDLWVPDGPDGKRGHVEHYILDFDKALGVMAMVSPRETDGYLYAVDPGYSILSFATFGLWQRPWEKIPLLNAGPRRGVGRFESVVFEPELWRPRIAEPAFLVRDRFDDFWAAKRMMTLSKEHVRAAVKAGRYSDPIAEYYVYDTLLARREKLARYAFERVTPLDRFEVVEKKWDFAVCFDDLWLVHRFGPDARTTYRFRQYDYHGRQIAKDDALASAESPTACTGALSAPRGEEGYTILAIDVLRSGKALEPVEVHLARSPEGKMRIVGLVRRPPS
jgi:hypothetical protein